MGPSAALIDESTDVLTKFGLSTERELNVCLKVVAGQHDLPRPRANAGQVFDLCAEHLSDDTQRKPLGYLAHEVELRTLGQFVEQFMCDPFNLRTHSRHASR